MKSYVIPFAALLAVVAFPLIRDEASAQNPARPQQVPIVKLKVITAVQNPGEQPHDRTHFSTESGDKIWLVGDLFMIGESTDQIAVPMSNVAYYKTAGSK